LLQPPLHQLAECYTATVAGFYSAVDTSVAFGFCKDRQGDPKRLFRGIRAWADICVQQQAARFCIKLWVLLWTVL